MSDHIENTHWWTRAIRPSPRKRLAAAGVAIALVAVTAGVWLSPSFSEPFRATRLVLSQAAGGGEWCRPARFWGLNVVSTQRASPPGTV